MYGLGDFVFTKSKRMKIKIEVRSERYPEIVFEQEIERHDIIKTIAGMVEGVDRGERFYEYCEKYPLKLPISFPIQDNSKPVERKPETNEFEEFNNFLCSKEEIEEKA